MLNCHHTQIFKTKSLHLSVWVKILNLGYKTAVKNSTFSPLVFIITIVKKTPFERQMYTGPYDASSIGQFGKDLQD